MRKKLLIDKYADVPFEQLPDEIKDKMIKEFLSGFQTNETMTNTDAMELAKQTVINNLCVEE